jgi:hypothetical protein
LSSFRRYAGAEALDAVPPESMQGVLEGKTFFNKGKNLILFWIPACAGMTAWRVDSKPKAPMTAWCLVREESPTNKFFPNASGPASIVNPPCIFPASLL